MIDPPPHESDGRTARAVPLTVDRPDNPPLAPFGIVPPALLERPRHEDVCDLDRDACAVVLDHQLRRLAHHDALCRRVLGRLAAALLDRDAHQALGFALLGDYTGERLGLSAREVQDAARVSRALADLPAITMAFERGDVSWTQARLLVKIATPDDEAAWLARAEGRTTRALDALVRETRTDVDARDALSRNDDDPAQHDGEPAQVDGEPAVRFRLRCPRRVRAQWRHVCELARRMAGTRLSRWQAVEAIAAEGLSGVDEAAGSDDGARSAGVGFADVPTEALPRLPPGVDVSAETRAAFGELDWTPIAEAVPADVSRLVEGIDTAGPHALDARLQGVVRMHRQIAWQTGRLLRLFADLRLPQALGFTSLSRYARERLGVSPRKAQTLIAIERRTWHAPAFGEAYRAGTLSCSRALSLLPVLHDGDAAAWVTRAGLVTVRRLADEVEWALNVQDTTRPYAPAAPPPLDARLDVDGAQMRARAAGVSDADRSQTWSPEPTGWETLDADIVAVGPASVMGLLRAAIAAFYQRPEPTWRGFERLLTHVEATWTAQPRHRDPVFARDGWRCAVPACSARRNLHDHHVQFRSHGGPNLRANRITVCAQHHLRGIHGRRVRAWGTAPDAVHWELGTRAGEPPLLHLVGDRYVSMPGARLERARG